MKIIYKAGTVVVFLLIIFVSSCTSSRQNVTIIETVREGTKGLEMSFLDSTPPKEVYEDNNVVLSFDISNEGAYDITGGKFALTTEDSYLQVVDWVGPNLYDRSTFEKTAMFNLYGKSQKRAEGEKTTISIRAKTMMLDEQTETHTTSAFLTACYPYKTTLVQDVCIDPDVYNTKKINKICEVKDIPLQNQGAPVAVTDVSTVTLTSDDYQEIYPQFTLTVTNAGNGQVFDIDKVDEVCSSASLAKGDVNYVRVSAKLSGKTLDCKPNPVHLINKEATVQCTLNSGISTGSSYTAPLIVELGYTYSFAVSKEFIIKKTGTSLRG